MSVEKHISKINEIVTSTMNAVRACKSRTGTVKILRESGLALSEEVEYFKAHHKRVFTDTRKQTQILRNALSSVADGIESGDLSRPELRSGLSYVEKHLSDFDVVSQSDVEKVLSKSAQKNVELTPNQLRVVEDLSSSAAKNAAKVVSKGDRSAVALPSEVPEALKQFASFKDALPTRITSAYEIVRLPVVPIFSEAIHLNNRLNLEKIGIKGVSLEGYTILDRQPVLLFSRREAKKHDLSPLEFAEAALSSINEQLSQKLAFVSDSFIANPKNADHLLFWLMPQAKIVALFKAAGSKMGTPRWGLPF